MNIDSTLTAVEIQEIQLKRARAVLQAATEDVEKAIPSFHRQEHTCLLLHTLNDILLWTERGLAELIVSLYDNLYEGIEVEHNPKITPHRFSEVHTSTKG